MNRLTIAWKNPSHFLLQQPAAAVEILDGPEVPNKRVIQWPVYSSVPQNVLTPDSSSSNSQWTYTLPAFATWLSIDFSFNYSYGGTTYKLLRVLQLINLAQVIPWRWFQTVTDAGTQDALSRALQQSPNLDVMSGAAELQHPLLSLRSSGNELTLTIANDFVDVTDLWEAMHGRIDDAKLYKQYSHPENNLLVLAYTGGSPLLWFAVVPQACKTGGTVHAHVFFRPLGSSPLSDVPPGDVTGLTLPNQQSVGGDPAKRDYQYNIAWSTLNRYLLGPTTRTWILNQMIQGCWPHEGNYALNAGLEDSLWRSQKPAILFLPQTSIARGYGDALTNKLPPCLSAAFALIRSRYNVLSYLQRYQLAGPFGMSGYSQGGNAVLSVLAANRNGPIDSIFLFQPNDLETQFAGPLAQLAGAAKKLTVCIITQSIASPAVQRLKSQVESSGRQTKVILMPDPARPQFYHFFPSAGQNDWIRYLFRKFLAPQTPTAEEKKACSQAGHAFTDDEMKSDLSRPGATGTKWTDFLHQFAIVGGQTFPYKPETYDETPLKKTFFQEALEQSL